MAVLSGSSPPSNPPPPLLNFEALRGLVAFCLLFWRRVCTSSVGRARERIREVVEVEAVYACACPAANGP